MKKSKSNTRLKREKKNCDKNRKIIIKKFLEFNCNTITTFTNNIVIINNKKMKS